MRWKLSFGAKQRKRDIKCKIVNSLNLERNPDDDNGDDFFLTLFHHSLHFQVESKFNKKL